MPTNLGSYARAPAAWLNMLAIFIGGCASTPASVEISDVEEVAAVVTAIDQGQRLVTIRGPQGNEVTFQAGPEVQNLAQVRTGDVVRLSYEQAYLATRTDADEMSASVPVAAAAARAEPGQRPGGMIGAMATITVRIESVGPGGRSVTYAEPNEQLHAIYLRREEAQAFVRSLRPGDIVELTHVEALAITVEPLGE